VSGQERRKSPRFVVEVPARLTVGHDVLIGRLRDVCRDAALVEADRSFPLETEVKVAMELPGTGGPLMVTGKVIRIGDGEAGAKAMAILFRDISPSASARIDFFIAQQEA
jgi:hypothetical protein